ncbi:MAG TPA: hypothetical protein VMB34_22665 [Acetobacteraceae bacterium]|nr:hypothetical protein [Acetobacteraceae bacterium]
MSKTYLDNASAAVLGVRPVSPDELTAIAGGGGPTNVVPYVVSIPAAPPGVCASGYEDYTHNVSVYTGVVSCSAPPK